MAIALELLLTPGWTSYNKRIQYQAYDVTSLLKRETMQLVLLSEVDGTERRLHGMIIKFVRQQSCIAPQLEITYADAA